MAMKRDHITRNGTIYQKLLRQKQREQQVSSSLGCETGPVQGLLRNIGNNRRSPVVCISGFVAWNQLPATNTDFLKNGGNTVDAAVAIAAALNFTKPCSTGIGLTCFCLCYDANTKKVQGLSGSGRSPEALTIELLKVQVLMRQSLFLHAHNITVPSTTASWCEAVSLYGSKKILQAAIKWAEKCFPVSEITAYHWKCGAHVLQAPGNKPGKELHSSSWTRDLQSIFEEMIHLIPLFVLSSLQYQELTKSGKRRFYEGCVAETIIESVQKNGGIMDLEDLKSQVTDEVKPIYKDVNVWEIPPDGQGITALIALHILDNFNVKDLDIGHNTADYLHVLIEALKLSFSVTFWFCVDRDKFPVPTKELLSKTYAKGCSEVVNLQKASDKYNKGNLLLVGSDTVYFTVFNGQGNTSYVINSNYMGLGIGLELGGCGFTLQNRGSSFSLSPSHLNCLAPSKWLYHMIIPALATVADTGDLLCFFGIMGGFMTPQGHMQDISNVSPLECALEMEREYKLKERENELPKVP
ncbi:glutathione hydrolase-like YwrD proenzyme [Gopherus flavomarginatus]|uniref:glutathione hydrolase-like YwrD proenzyme n=1 Tax=Gopherus flavomarginatus TaxID=286002 RepID=UPI0021CBE8A8|nr:glutathione hydrolase-like YwrD proenzyme [Gopherus flavomarginatus]